MIQKYCKRPVVIEAIKWDGNNTAAVHEFIHGQPPAITCRAAEDGWEAYCEAAKTGGLSITTLEDGPDGRARHVATVGDYIIRGVAGEFYPCKPDIFEATYEKA